MSGLVIGIIILIIIVVVVVVIATRSSSGSSGTVSCATDNECPSSAPRCDVASGKCYPCIAVNAPDSKCPSDRPYCVANQCKLCTDTAGCTPPLLCDQGNACEVCRNSGDCSSPTPVCLDDHSACVECFNSRREGFSLFGKKKKMDDMPKKAAIQALARATTSPTSPYCKDPTFQYCDETRHLCVGCVTSSDCQSPTPVCVNNTCATCTGDSEGCPEGMFCLNGTSCVVCRGDSDCPSDIPRCLDNNACTQC